MTGRHLGFVSAIVSTCAVLSACAAKELKEPPAQGTSAYRTQVLADKPIAYWRLDEPIGTVAFDQMGERNKAAVSDGVSLKEAGATADGDLAMSLDGTTGEIGISNAPALEIRNGTITLEIWIKPSSAQTGQIMILAKGAAGVQTEYALVLQDGVPGYQSVGELYLAKTPAVATGAWTHFVATVADNKVLVLYVNGKESGTFPVTSNHLVTASTQPLMIGNEANLSARFAGVVDEPAVYGAALTAAQVARHFSLAAQK